MCDPHDGPSQQLVLTIPNTHAPQIREELHDQFTLAPAHAYTGKEATVLSYVYLLDELTMDGWWRLLAYVQRQKFEERITRSELTIVKRHRSAISEDLWEDFDCLVQAQGALVILEKFPTLVENVFGAVSPVVRHALLAYIDQIQRDDWFAEQGQAAAHAALASYPAPEPGSRPSEIYNIIREALTDLVKRQENVKQGQTLVAQALNLLEEAPHDQPLAQGDFTVIHQALWEMLNLTHERVSIRQQQDKEQKDG